MADVSVDVSTLRSVSAHFHSAVSETRLEGAVTRASGTALGSDTVAAALQAAVDEQLARAEITGEVLSSAAREPADAAFEFERLDRRLLGAV